MNRHFSPTRSETLRARIDMTLANEPARELLPADRAGVAAGTAADASEADVVHAVMTFRIFDPFAVSITFSYADCPAVEWVCARELFRDGLDRPSGTGDVRVHPSWNDLVIELYSPQGKARLKADRAHVAAFVERMYRAVPDGMESDCFSLDQELELLA